MKISLVPVAVACVSGSLLSSASVELSEKFENFLSTYNKSYSDDEKAVRFGYFVDSLNSVAELNEKNPDMEFGLSALSDASPEERAALFNPNIVDLSQHTSAPMIGETQNFDPQVIKLPRNLDYRNINGVNCASPVRDQKSCGACWAFTTATIVEGAWCLKFGELKPLSPQHFMDCDAQQDACLGGNMLTAVNFSAKGVCPWEKYPYENRKGQCRRANCQPTAMIGASQGMRVIPAEAPLVNMLNKNGPVGIAVAYNAHYRFLEGYKNGNISAARCNANRQTGGGPDHAMTVMGYKWDEQAKQLWFLVRNSYGTSWGQGGYSWMEFGACGWAIHNMDTAQINGTKDQMLKGFAAARIMQEGASISLDADAEEEVPESLVFVDEGVEAFLEQELRA